VWRGEGSQHVTGIGLGLTVDQFHRTVIGSGLLLRQAEGGGLGECPGNGLDHIALAFGRGGAGVAAVFLDQEGPEGLEVLWAGEGYRSGQCWLGRG